VTRLYVTKGLYPREYLSDTVDFIVRTQLKSGDIPWFEGGSLDPWDHIESAMGLAIGGKYKEARMAYQWLAEMQLSNGSWLAAYQDGEIADGTRAESNFVAYIATGLWHYYLITEDIKFLQEFWPVLDRAMNFVIRLKGDQGQIYWAEDTTDGIKEDSLITGCSSIYKSFECALNIAATLNIEKPEWQSTKTDLLHALRHIPDCFDRTWDSKSRFAMDWFYPVLTGVISGSEGRRHLEARWDEFVVDQMGCRCVNDEPWVTVAESCELVMALLSVGETHKAVEVFSWLHQFRDNDGAYWTGYVYTDKALWPLEKPTWTAGAVLLAADALSHYTQASSLFLGPSGQALQNSEGLNYTKILKKT